MRITCPICGSRDHREFSFKGEALGRPDGTAPDAAWQDYLHLRDNVAGNLVEHWSHDAGCGAWLVVTRNTVTHVVTDVQLAKGAEA